MKRMSKEIFRIIAVASFMLLAGFNPVVAQDDMVTDYTEMEKVQDENMNYLQQLYKITKDYPLFSYKYEINNGEVKDVTVTGIDKDVERKKIEVMLLDLKSNKNMIKSKANRMGVFYSVDVEPQYKDGRDALVKKLNSMLKYPKGAQNWGVEGTIYVRFVVDDNGHIPYASTTQDIETSFDFYVDDLEKQAIDAIRKTSGEWQPGKVNGVNVASFIVLPVIFDLRKAPGLPLPIY